MQNCLARKLPGAEIPALRQIFIWWGAVDPCLDQARSPGFGGGRRPRHRNCTLTDPGGCSPAAPRTPRNQGGWFTASAATRLIRGRGRQKGVRDPRRARGGPRLSEDGWFLAPSSSSPHSPRRGVSDAPGVAAFQRGLDNRAHNVARAVKAPSQVGEGSRLISTREMGRLQPTAAPAGPQRRWAPPRPPPHLPRAPVPASPRPGPPA